jgi:ribulose-phosphate 3-epimerase
MKTHNIEIVPSLLSADFGRLAAEIQTVESVGATRLHLDVMDGHFVPNITIGPFIVEAIRRITNLHLESHLMIENPEKYLQNFIDAGSNTIIVHVESCREPISAWQSMKKQGVKAGIVLNPPTPFSAVEPWLGHVDHLLVMTVDPGFGGQKMIESELQKVTQALPYKAINPFFIEVDGGINLSTVPKAVAAGADLLVAGSAVFQGGNPGFAYMELSRRANQ